MRKLIAFVLIFSMILSIGILASAEQDKPVPKDSSEPEEKTAVETVDDEQKNFLRDMAYGLNKRRLASASGQGDKSLSEFYKELVLVEIDSLAKYENTSFSDEAFDTFAHDYLDACNLQLKATEYSDYQEIFENIWESGYFLRSFLITKAYENYALDILEGNYKEFKDAINAKANGSEGNSAGGSVTQSYLMGYWSSRNGMHTFEMKKDYSYITTVPVVPKCGDTYDLNNGILYQYYANNPSKKTANLRFTAISDTEMEVYSYQTKDTYTLFKRR